jgi:hypothetical protein
MTAQMLDEAIAEALCRLCNGNGQTEYGVRSSSTMSFSTGTVFNRTQRDEIRRLVDEGILLLDPRPDVGPRGNDVWIEFPEKGDGFQLSAVASPFPIHRLRGRLLLDMEDGETSEGVAKEAKRKFLERCGDNWRTARLLSDLLFTTGALLRDGTWNKVAQPQGDAAAVDGIAALGRGSVVTMNSSLGFQCFTTVVGFDEDRVILAIRNEKLLQVCARVPYLKKEVEVFASYPQSPHHSEGVAFPDSSRYKTQRGTKWLQGAVPLQAEIVFHRLFLIPGKQLRAEVEDATIIRFIESRSEASCKTHSVQDLFDLGWSHINQMTIQAETLFSAETGHHLQKLCQQLRDPQACHFPPPKGWSSAAPKCSVWTDACRALSVGEIIDEDESSTIEFKYQVEAWSQTGVKGSTNSERIRQTFCGMVNCFGGHVLIGVADDGKIVGTRSLKDELRLSAFVPTLPKGFVVLREMPVSTSKAGTLATELPNEWWKSGSGVPTAGGAPAKAALQTQNVLVVVRVEPGVAPFYCTGNFDGSPHIWPMMRGLASTIALGSAALVFRLLPHLERVRGERDRPSASKRGRTED